MTTAVQETGVSRDNGDPIESPPELLKHHSTMITKGLRGALNCEPILLRKAKLSDKRCSFFLRG